MSNCLECVQVPLGRYQLVELEAGLHPSHVHAIQLNFLNLPGVLSVTDMAIVPQSRFDEMKLLEPAPKKHKRGAA